MNTYIYIEAICIWVHIYNHKKKLTCICLCSSCTCIYVRMWRWEKKKCYIYILLLLICLLIIISMMMIWEWFPWNDDICILCILLLTPLLSNKWEREKESERDREVEADREWLRNKKKLFWQIWPQLKWEYWIAMRNAHRSHRWFMETYDVMEKWLWISCLF